MPAGIAAGVAPLPAACRRRTLPPIGPSGTGGGRARRLVGSRAVLRRLLLCCLLLPAFALAQAPPEGDEAEALALEAAQAHQRHCSDAAGMNMSNRTTAVAEVSAVWARVHGELERSRKAYLLYWRGVLGECLDQEEPALADLKAFVAARAGSDRYATQVADAQRRIRRLERSLGGAGGGSVAGPVVAVALGVGAGTAGGLAGWQWGVATTTADELYAEPHSGTTLTELVATGDRAQTTSRVLVGTAAGLGVGSVVAIIASAAAPKRTAGVERPLPVFAVAPTPEGVAFSLGGRW
jgi:hypothetical protein